MTNTLGPAIYSMQRGGPLFRGEIALTLQESPFALHLHKPDPCGHFVLQWNLSIKDKLGPGILSTVERLSILQR